MAYYYLMSQLPSISSISNAPISYSYFKEVASRFLTKKDSKVLEELSIEPPRIQKKTGSNFLDAWYEYERALRLALEQARATKLNWTHSVSSEEKSIVTRNFEPAQVAKTVIEMDNPLEAEKFLNSARFAKAELPQSSKAFSKDAVFSYGIKLMLAERASKFQDDKGRVEYKTTYNRILEEK